jgi:hypothetical protein
VNRLANVVELCHLEVIVNGILAKILRCLAASADHPAHDLECVVLGLRVPETIRSRLFRTGENVRNSERVAANRDLPRKGVARGKRWRGVARRRNSGDEGRGRH